MPSTRSVQTTSVSIIDIPDYIEDWVNQFYKAKRQKNVSPNTLIFYKQQLKYFKKYCDDQIVERISQLTPVFIRDFLLWMEETGHNPGGRHAAYRVLKTFLRWYNFEAEPEGWKNPINKVDAPKLEEEPLDPIELENVKAMVVVCDNSFLGRRDKAILLFLLDTGLRARELLSLNIRDVNFVTGQVSLIKGKGRKPRDVFIERKTKKATIAYLKMRHDELSALFILDERIARLGYGGLRKILKRRAEMANIEEPTAHEFRRAFAINMLRKEVDPLILSKLLGHTSEKVMKRYLKFLVDDLEAAQRKGSPVEFMDS